MWGSCIVFLTSVARVSLAYYCDHNLCHAAEEYCCGDNLCCDYANSSSYFWLSILVVLLLLSLLWALVGLFCLPALHRRRELVKLLFAAMGSGLRFDLRRPAAVSLPACRAPATDRPL